jgi:hypothetical protein
MNGGCWEMYWGNKHVYIYIYSRKKAPWAQLYTDIKIHQQLGPIIVVRDSLISLTRFLCSKSWNWSPLPAYKDSICRLGLIGIIDDDKEATCVSHSWYKGKQKRLKLLHCLVLCFFPGLKIRNGGDVQHWYTCS